MKKLVLTLFLGIVIGTLFIGTCPALAIGSIKLVVNGNEVQCDVPPQVISGRTMIPAKYLGSTWSKS